MVILVLCAVKRAVQVSVVTKFVIATVAFLHAPQFLLCKFFDVNIELSTSHSLIYNISV